MTIDEAIRIIKIVLAVAEDFEITVQGEEFTKEKCKEAVEMAIKALEQEPCDDCVSRQAAIDAFERFIHELGIKDEPYNYGEMALSPQNVPPVKPIEKVGHWEYKQYDIAFPEIGNYHCSSCDAVGKNGDNYCSVCGAKMQIKKR